MVVPIWPGCSLILLAILGPWHSDTTASVAVHPICDFGLKKAGVVGFVDETAVGVVVVVVVVDVVVMDVAVVVVVVAAPR